MLRGVVLELARRGHSVSFFSRTPRRAGALVGAAPPGAVHGHTFDWRVPGATVVNTGEALSRGGPVALAVVWLHANAWGGPLAIASALAVPGRPFRFVHVLGSASADPSRGSEVPRATFEAVEGIAYEEVVLGFVRSRRGSRWLTDDEIAAGVLGAIDRPAPRTIVGTVEPWGERP